VWNLTPLAAACVKANGDPAAAPAYWTPVVRFLDRHLGPSYRVEAVDTAGHWPAAYLPEAGIPLVRGWYRQADFPENAILYGDLGSREYTAWLRRLGVRYVVLTDAPPDFSARAEADLLRSGRVRFRVAFRSRHATVFAVPNPVPIVTGPGTARVLRLDETQLVLGVGRPGTYRVALNWSPYWRPSEGCVSQSPAGTLLATVPRAGRVTLSFDVGAMRLLRTLVDSDGRRCV
jgi:hypothetical protein